MNRRWICWGGMIAAMAVTAMGTSCPMNMNPNPNPGDDDKGPTLFVVNNNQSVTSYAESFEADGNVAFTTRLPAGAATDLFQPRSLVVTTHEVLIVSRQNGGITSHIEAFEANGNVPATRIVEGTDAHVGDPISLAYDDKNDRLFVGNISAEQGILVFDNCSAATFNNERAPSRVFNPPDRAPSNNMEMTIDAMQIDAQGNLWVSDTSGTNQNSSRILVFANAGAATGSTPPARTITSSSWAGIEDLAVDDPHDTLYVVDGSSSVKIFRPASTLSGNNVTPLATLTCPDALLGSLQGVVVDEDEDIGFVADTANHAIYVYEGFHDKSGLTTQPNHTIKGNDTGLSSPRQMFLADE